MVRSKPSKLANLPLERRADERTAVNLAGRCRAGDREEQEVLVTEIGAAGCRMLGLSAGVTKNDRLELWLGDSGPFAAKLKWAKRGLFGIEFDHPLDAALVQSLASADAETNVVPMRRGWTD